MEDNKFDIGDIVKCSKYGYGIIMDCRAYSNARIVYRILFFTDGIMEYVGSMEDEDLKYTRYYLEARKNCIILEEEDDDE